MTKKHKMKQAVALSYREDMTAPTVVASGTGLVAENILAKAKENQIPVYEDEKLATILGELELGQSILPELYEVVARILIFVGDMDELYAKTKSKQKGSR